jgi:hypothetical protein
MIRIYDIWPGSVLPGDILMLVDQKRTLEFVTHRHVQSEYIISRTWQVEREASQYRFQVLLTEHSLCPELILESLILLHLTALE